MTAPEPSTVDGALRTAAARAASARTRRRQKAERLCAELVERLDTLDGPMLAAITVKFMAECERRGVALRERAS